MVVDGHPVVSRPRICHSSAPLRLRRRMKTLIVQNRTGYNYVDVSTDGRERTAIELMLLKAKS